MSYSDDGGEKKQRKKGKSFTPLHTRSSVAVHAELARAKRKGATGSRRVSERNTRRGGWRRRRLKGIRVVFAPFSRGEKGERYKEMAPFGRAVLLDTLFMRVRVN